MKPVHVNIHLNGGLLSGEKLRAVSGGIWSASSLFRVADSDEILGD